MVTLCDGDSSLSKRDVGDIIAIDISRFMRDDFPCMINTIRDE